jgi:hypothetical protein
MPVMARPLVGRTVGCAGDVVSPWPGGGNCSAPGPSPPPPLPETAAAAASPPPMTQGSADRLQQQRFDRIDARIAHGEFALLRVAQVGEPFAAVFVEQHQVAFLAAGVGGEETVDGDDLARGGGDEQIVAGAAHRPHLAARQLYSDDRCLCQGNFVGGRNFVDRTTALFNYFQRDHSRSHRQII